MIIGVPKEIKAQENRVGAVPAMVMELVAAGHTVLVERSAGLGAGILDSDFEKVGAKNRTQALVRARELGILP